MKKGCIILIIIAAVILIGAGLLWINKDKIINFAMEKSFEAMEKAVVTNLPVSIAQDSARALFDRTLDKIKSREINSEELKEDALSASLGADQHGQVAKLDLGVVELSHVPQGEFHDRCSIGLPSDVPRGARGHRTDEAILRQTTDSGNHRGKLSSAHPAERTVISAHLQLRDSAR